MNKAKNFQLYFFARTIGIKNTSGGIGKKIDSTDEITPKKLKDFLFPEILIVL